MQLAKLEPLVAGYHSKLARIDAGIQELDPQLLLPPRRYRKNPYFERGELPRLAMQIMREAGEPMRVRDIAIRALAMKGIHYPDRVAMRRARKGLQHFFIAAAKRGTVRTIGWGKETRRELVET